MDSLVITLDGCRILNLPRLVESALSDPGCGGMKQLLRKAGRRLLRANAAVAAGLDTAAKSLAAIDYAVFETRRIPLESLSHALSIDFQATNLTEAWAMVQVYRGLYDRGAVTPLRLQAVNNYQCGHYNDGEFIRRLLLDSIDKDRAAFYRETLLRLCRQAGIRADCPREWNAALGAGTGATPDGRRAGAPFC